MLNLFIIKKIYSYIYFFQKYLKIFAILIFLNIILIEYTFCHIDIFSSSNSTIDNDELFESNYAIEVTFNSQYSFVNEIGYDYFETGKDDSAIVQLIIFDSETKKELYNQEQIIEGIHGQLIYFSVNIHFQSNKKYIFQLINNENYICNLDNRIRKATPKEIPLSDISKKITAWKLFNNKSSNYPIETSTNHPLIHIGITNQTGIELFSNNSIYYPKTNIYYTKISPLKELLITEIGLKTKKKYNNILKFQLYNLTNNKTEFEIDTLLNSPFNSKILFPTQIKLDTNKIYLLKFDFLEKLDSSIYLTNVITPSIDNLNYITTQKAYYSQINDFNSAIVTDKVLPIIFNFKNSNSAILNTETFLAHGLDLRISEKKIEFYIPTTFNDIQLYDFIGQKIPFSIEKINDTNYILNHNQNSKIVILKIDNTLKKIEIF